MDMLLERIYLLNLDYARHQAGFWDGVLDDFNAKFEGKRISGGAERQTKITLEMLVCALLDNDDEYSRVINEAGQRFRADVKAAEGRD